MNTRPLSERLDALVDSLVVLIVEIRHNEQELEDSRRECSRYKALLEHLVDDVDNPE